MLFNVAPVMPETTLAAISNALSDADDETLSRCTYLVQLLRSLAYEPELFVRCIALLVRFAALPDGGQQEPKAKEVLRSLFHAILSGTHAPIEMRVRAAEELLRSGDPAKRSLGVEVLEALMKTHRFSSYYEFTFGARSRDHGYHCRGAVAVRAWFGAALDLAKRFATPGGPVADDVQKALARQFRGLWRDTGLTEELDGLVREIGSKSFWREGWIAARQTRMFDGGEMQSELRERLVAVEEFLRPKDLISKVQGLVIAARSGGLDLDEFDDEVENDEEVKGTSRTQVYDLTFLDGRSSEARLD